MVSYVETSRRLGKLEPNEWKYLNVTNAIYVLHSLHGKFNGVQYFILFLNSWRDSAFLIFSGRISQSFAPRLETVSLPYLHDLIILLSKQLFFSNHRNGPWISKFRSLFLVQPRFLFWIFPLIVREQFFHE